MARKASVNFASFEPSASQRMFVLYGPERFLLTEYTRRIADALRAEHGEIETFSFDGETAAPAAVLDELRSYGLMQRHKLVVLENAELFLAGGGKRALENEDNDAEDGGESGKKAASRRPLMEKYAEHPVAEATLVMRAAIWRAGKLDKLVERVGAIVPCELATDEKAASWCEKRCVRRHDATIEPEAARLLVQRCGTSLQLLDNELARLSLMAGPGEWITHELVASMVGSSREERAWEVQSAVLTGRAADMLLKTSELLEVSRHDVIPLNWSVIDLLRKLHAASQLFKRGLPPQAIAGQLRLYPNPDPVLSMARRAEPKTFAQLLQHAVEADQSSKSGVGTARRNLEALLVRIADTLARRDSRAE